ncbi:MAG: histidinol dehydrogenase [bacterium]
MQTLRPTDKTYRRAIESLKRRYEADVAVRSTVEEILAAVAKEGDEALLDLSKKFGGPDLQPSQIPVTPLEIAEACQALPTETRKAIDAARSNVKAFAKRSLRKSWFMKNRQGAITGERFDPFQRVGIYIPGGTAPLVSTAVMTCTLAQVAGVPEIVAVTPAGADGKIQPALLAALSRCGATEIYRVGGAQAVAALAYGTKTILPVQKIFGPGNSYVVEAKRQVFGRVAIDLLPGPSEVLVIADKTAKPDWVAADLLAQAEHGHGSQALLVTDSEKILTGVEKALERQTKLSKRPAELAKALKNTKLILVEDMQEAIRVANDYASEHVSVATESPGEIALQLRTSGAIFLGRISPVAGGDFLAGPSHELPTGGAGRSFAGLTVDQFQRRTSIVMFDEESLRASLPHIETFSAIEGLDAHGRSASIRLQK